MPTPTVALTQDQIDFFHHEGYLTLPALTSPEEVAFMRTLYDELFSKRAGRDVGDQFDLGGSDEDGKTPVLPQILNPERYEPRFKETQLRVNAEAVAKQLLGPQAGGGGAHAILKPAHYGATTPWHQDEAYWNPAMDYSSISIWVPLQPATLENGCMQFIPRSHQLPDVLPHHSINNDPRVHGLEVDDSPQFRELAKSAVPCPIPPGGCTIHKSRTFHYAGPNRSDQPRRAYILAYSLPATARTTPRRFPWNEMKVAPRQERAAKGGGLSEPATPGKTDR